MKILINTCYLKCISCGSDCFRVTLEGKVMVNRTCHRIDTVMQICDKCDSPIEIIS